MITLQTQPHGTACVATCVAMVLGVPVDTIMPKFHQRYCEHEFSIQEFLAECGVMVKRTEDRSSLEHDKVYFLVVPSLNSKAQFHMVLCDTRGGDCVIYDPARKGSQRYVRHEAGIGETAILSWIIDYEVIHAPNIGLNKGVN